MRELKNAVHRFYKRHTALLICMERVMRIELTTSAWKAEVLPLNYTRKYVIHIWYFYIIQRFLKKIKYFVEIFFL